MSEGNIPPALRMDDHSKMVIESLGVYLPPRAITSAEILAQCRKKILFPLEQVTGIRSRRVAENEFSLDLATKAITDCLVRSENLAQHVDLLICCNISRYDAPNRFSFEPSSAAMLAARFGMQNALTFDLSNACAGVFTGIYVAESYLRSGAASRALVVSGEYITHLTKTAQLEMTGLLDPQLASLTLGDSGIALMLELRENSEVGFGPIELYTLGKFSRYCVAQAATGAAGGAKMVTDSVRLSSVAVSEATSHGFEMQERQGWAPEEMDHYILHQTSERTLRNAMTQVNRHYKRDVFTEKKTVFNVRDRGNTATTSHFVALRDSAVQGSIQPGESVLFSVNASGLTIGGGIYVCDDLPLKLAPDFVAEKRVSAPNLSAVHVAQRVADPVDVIGIGVAERCIRDPGETLELAGCAAIEALTNANVDRHDVDLVIFSGAYRTDHVSEPAIAAMIAGDLKINDRRGGLNRKTLCFDLLAGAIGTLKACSVASSLIGSGKANVALVVASEIDLGVGLNIKPMGSAMVLSRNAGAGFQSFFFQDEPEEHWSFESYCNLSVPGGKIEFSQAPDLEAVYAKRIARQVKRCVESHQIDLPKIRFVLAPQISPAFLDLLKSNLQIEAKWIDATSAGDLFTSSLPVELRAAAGCSTRRPGDLALCLGISSGGQFGCSLYQFS